MLTSREKLKLRKFIYSKITFIVLMVIFILFARGTWSAYKKSERARENEDQARQDLDALGKRAEFLKKELRDLDTERGREAQLRSRYDVGRDGEKMIVIVDNEVAPPPVVKKPKTTWQKFISFFGGED